jgi:hypothetical protein
VSFRLQAEIAVPRLHLQAFGQGDGRRALIGARQLYDAGAEAFTNVGIYERDRLIARRPAGRASDRPAIPTTHKVLSTRPAASQSRASLMENCKALNGHRLDFVIGHDR